MRLPKGVDYEVVPDKRPAAEQLLDEKLRKDTEQVKYRKVKKREDKK